MTETRTRAFVGFAGVVAAGFLTASLSSSGCGSSGGTAGTTGGAGTTGAAGHAGTTGGGAGQTGNAGVSGTAGVTGTGGGSACTTVAAGAGAISSFMDGGASVGIGTPYAGAQSGLTSPTFDSSSGALVLTFNTGVPTMQYPYAYVGIPFNACVNASAFTGVKFTASGSLSAGCTIQFSTLDKGHNTVANMGTCSAASCYPSSKIFTLPATAGDVTVNFLDQTGGGANAGAPVVDPTEITGIQWQINPVGPAAADAGGGMSCTGTVTIDNVTFM